MTNPEAKNLAETVDLRGARGDVLIVDDNPNNLSLLTLMLRDAGYRVRIANSGQRALAAVDAQPPEIVMLDVSMPDLDGYAVCRALKAKSATRDIPVIFLSALDGVTDKIAAFKVGGIDYVTKPFHTEEVLARVETQLSLARLYRALAEKNRELADKNAELLRARQTNAEMFTALSNALPGNMLDGKYQIERKIGAGGFAAVYRGRHVALEREVAIKLLRPDLTTEPDKQLERFRREGVATTRVVHPNVVAVLDSGLANGVAYLVMELLEGRTVAEEQRDRGPFSVERAAQIVHAACEGLAAAHAAGIIHRDIKPSNLFLHQPQGRDEVVKLVDFGIAKPQEEGDEANPFTTVGRLIGTPIYMSPERMLGHAYDARADLYSVGMMLYEMLTGKHPFEAKEGGLGRLVMLCMTQVPEPPSSKGVVLPPELDQLIVKMLAKKPDDRPTLEDIQRTLRPFAG